MKKKPLLLSLLMVASVFTLGSCNSNNNGNPDVEIHWSDNKTYLDESKLSGEMLTTTKVRVHYVRPTLDYDNWNIWGWEIAPEGGQGKSYNFGMYDNDGIVADIPLKEVASHEVEELGIIIRKSVADNDWSEKDVDKDRSIKIPEKSSDGIYDVYMRKGREMIYDSKEAAEGEDIVSCYASYLLRGEKNFTANIKLTIDGKKIDPSKVSLYENGQPLTNYKTKIFADSKMIQLVMDKGFEFNFDNKYSVKYQFAENNTVEADLVLYDLYNVEQFGEKYNYYGDDLGVTFNKEKTQTTFKLWAPVSEEVKVNIYNSGTKSQSNKPIKTLPLTKGEKGVFSLTCEEYLHGKYYTYTVKNGDDISEVVDPYAKSCGVNGNIGMIVDFDKINEELEWDKVKRPTLAKVKNNVDASIYEIHVRDMTIDSTSGVKKENRGKFLGLAETGTTYTKDGKTVSTGLDHLKELGISHVQIQPFYDYASIDETKDDGYNWGYDPLNYNCLEGSYSTNPEDGLVRIKEFKTMMKAMLENNIQVNMDVVYNHTAGSDNTNFEKIVPGYYHRLDTSFNYSNGSGCGNEMATEHYMYRKFVVDSCKFWLKEYKLSGYRFDLMGLIDVDTMAEVYNECHKIYEDVMVYGEPWTGGATPLSGLKQTNQSTVGDMEALVGAFNDKIRNAVKGDNAPGKGWVQGVSKNVRPIRDGLKGNFSYNIDPNKVINYVSCHDNYTLFDQLDRTLEGSRKTNLKDVYKQSEALVFTSQGVTFMQEGEDFMRTKAAGKGSEVHNSYMAGDKVNKMDYSLKIKNLDMFNYFKDLIKMRSDEPLFRLANRDLINTQMKFVGDDNSIIAFKITSEDKEIYVIHTLDAVANYDLGGSYKVLLDHEGLHSNSTSVSKLNLKANDSVVLVKA